MPVDPKWLAGFVDADGSVGLLRRGRAGLIPYCNIYNTNLAVLREIQAEFGGVLYVKKRRKEWKPVGYLIFQYMKAFNLLTIIEPHLKIKRRQATLVLFHRQGARYRGHQPGFSPSVPEEVAQFREFLRFEVRALNQRGG